MKKTTGLIIIAGMLTLFVGVLSIAPAHALRLAPVHILANSKTDACAGLNQVSGSGCGGGQAGITKVLGGVVTIISYLAGAIAIIMVIISGIRYTTSGGDSAQVGAAKTALIYALIGVAVAALAQVLVHFVLNQASGV